MDGTRRWLAPKRLRTESGGRATAVDRVPSASTGVCTHHRGVRRRTSSVAIAHAKQLTALLVACNRFHETGSSGRAVPKKAVTIRDVALRAGVSVATASRAMNGTSSSTLRPETGSCWRRKSSATREPDRSPPEPRPDADHRRRGHVPHAAAIDRAIARRGCGPRPTVSSTSSSTTWSRSQKRDRYLGDLVQFASDRRVARHVAAAAGVGRGRAAVGTGPDRLSSTCTRRRSRRCRGSSATTSVAERSRPAISSTSGTATSPSSGTRPRTRSGSPRAGPAGRVRRMNCAGLA